MNILFFIDRYPGYGGIEIVTTHLANYLVNQGNNVGVYSFSQQHNLRNDLDHRVCTYKCIQTKDKNSLININQIQNIIETNNYNKIIFQDSYNQIEGILESSVKQISGIKIDIYIVEHNTPDYAIKSFKTIYRKDCLSIIKRAILYPYSYFKIKRKTIKRHTHLYDICTRYILLSNSFIDIYKRMMGNINLQKLTYINNPLTITRPDHLDLCTKQKVVLFCGRLSVQKGIVHLMEIWKQVETDYPEWKLIIVGDGPEKGFIEHYIEEHHLRHIELTGFKSDLIPYYQTASILCMTSIFEGWALTLCEAMCYGCVPIQFNSYASVSDIIEDGKTGFLINPFDKTNYINKLEILISNDTKRNQMAIDGYKAINKFNIHTIGKEWQNLLSS